VLKRVRANLGEACLDWSLRAQLDDGVGCGRSAKGKGLGAEEEDVSEVCSLWTPW